MLSTYFIHVVPNTGESWYVAQEKSYVHTNFENLEGTLPASKSILKITKHRN